jgi:ATP-dependent exoDNAse (exonuclease V) beta subunit
MAARPGVGADRDRLFDFLRRQVRDAASLEAERLLYVACTRAKWQLRLTAQIGADEGEESVEIRPPRAVWSPRAGSLLAVLWPVIGAKFTAVACGAAAQPGGMGPPRGGPMCRVPTDWAPHLEMGLPGVDSTPAPTDVRDETPVFDWAGETARRVGTLVHAELHSMDITNSDERMIHARDPHFRRWLALHGVPADRLAAAAARVVESLIAVHRDPRGRWILQAARQDLREHALSGRWRGEVVRVVIDRSFIDDLGVRWIIDYKTSQHIGGGLEEFLDREVERYRAQLQRYAALARELGPEPVRVGLYFPLMRAWREWAS